MLKKYNNFILIFLLCFTYSTIFYDIPVSAQEITTLPTTTTISVENDTVVYSGDIIVWKYKNVNGKLYKRKYNQTTQKWIGSWIPA